MSSSALAAFGLDVPCRSVCPLYTNNSTTTTSSLLSSSGTTDESNIHRFLLGTAKFPGGGNKIYFVEYASCVSPSSLVGQQTAAAAATTTGLKLQQSTTSSSSSAIHAAAVWQVGSEVVDVQCCPNNKLEQTLFSTIVSTTGGNHRGSVLSCDIMAIGDLYVSTPSRVATLMATTRMCWDPQGLTSEVRGVVAGNTICEFKLGQAVGEASQSSSASLGGGAPVITPASTLRLEGSNDAAAVRCVNHIAWSPHHGHLLAAAVDNKILILDFRMSGSGSSSSLPIVIGGTAGAHGFGACAVLTLDFSPSTTTTLLSSGEDGYVRMWDIRRTSAPTSSSVSVASGVPSSQQLSSQRVHEHWCTRAVFNPFHDDLVLTCSSDNTCRLWNLPPAGPATDFLPVLDSVSLTTEEGQSSSSSISNPNPQQNPRSLAKRMMSGGATADAFLSSSPSLANIRMMGGPRRSSFGGGGGGGYPPTLHQPLGTPGGSSAASIAQEGCILALSDFADSVSSCCWSLANDSPWVFAAVSANGKMLVDTVPESTIQWILLGCTSD
jgi:WD40 repeat protein